MTPFRLLVVLLLEGNAPVTFSVNHRPDSTGFYTLPGTLTSFVREVAPESAYGAPVATTWARFVEFVVAHTGKRS